MLNHCIFGAFSIRPELGRTAWLAHFTSGAHNHTSHGQTVIYGKWYMTYGHPTIFGIPHQVVPYEHGGLTIPVFMGKSNPTVHHSTRDNAEMASPMKWCARRASHHADGSVLGVLACWLAVQLFHLEKWWSSSMGFGWHPYNLWNIKFVFETSNQWLLTIINHYQPSLTIINHH